MYVVVITMVVLSILGLLTQTVTLQAKRMYDAQTGFAQILLTWHNSVAQNVSHALYAGTLTGVSTTGCRLTASATSPVIAPCSTTISSADLPNNYNMTAYSFYSVVYSSSTGYYLTTFVHDTDANGNLILPNSGGYTVGFGTRELMRQLKTLNKPYTYYGIVQPAGTLTILTDASFSESTSAMSFPVPATIPTGSLALISTAN